MTRSLRPALATVLGAALLAALSGCGGSASGESGDVLSKVTLVHDGMLTVCSDVPYAPFEFIKKGQPAGFGVDIARRLAESLDVIDVAFDDITSGTSLNSGVCDMAASAMTITGERARVVDFSSPYFDAKQAMVVPKGSGLNSLASLAGERVGVQSETTGETFLRDFAPAGTKVVAFEDLPLLEKALVNGDVVAAVYDNTVSGPLTESNGQLKVAKEFDTVEQYGMAVKKDGNIPLLRLVNSELAELKESGDYRKVFDKYF